jgi:hypothetical protein
MDCRVHESDAGSVALFLPSKRKRDSVGQAVMASIFEVAREMESCGGSRRGGSTDVEWPRHGVVSS